VLKLIYRPERSATQGNTGYNMTLELQSHKYHSKQHVKAYDLKKILDEHTLEMHCVTFPNYKRVHLEEKDIYIKIVYVHIYCDGKLYVTELTDSPISINHLSHTDTLIVLNYLSLN